MLYVVAPNFQRARRLQDAISPAAGEVLFVLPSASDVRGRMLLSGDTVLFDGDYVREDGTPNWGFIEPLYANLELRKLCAKQRSIMPITLADGVLCEVVPDIGIPPIHDPVALAKWLLT